MQAFLILAHQDSAALNRLTSKLVEVGHVFIHIDKKSRIKLAPSLQANDRVRVASRFDLRWGQWSIVEATEFLADQAVAAGCTRITLLSGVDAPIVSKSKLQNLESDLADYVAAQTVAPGTVAAYLVERYRRKYIFAPVRTNRILTRIWHAIIRRAIILTPAIDYVQVLAPLEAKLGSQFWSVTADTYQAAVNLTKARPEIRRYFSSIFCPDEGYFQTLFAHVSKNLVNRGTTYVKWAERGAPRELEIEDIDREAASGTYFFARKVFSKNHDLVARLDAIWV